MSAPDITPAAVQIEDQLAMSFPGALHGISDIRPAAVFISAWNVTDFAALVAREGGPRVDLRDPRLYGVPIDGNPDFRRGFAQLVVHGQPRFAFDFTANLDADPRGANPGALLVLDRHGVADERRVSLRDLPPGHLLEEMVNEITGAPELCAEMSAKEREALDAILALAQLGLAIRARLA